MKSIILICAICLQLGWSYGAKRDPKGIGAFAYQDSNGHRYGGTYGLKDGQVTNVQGDYPGPFIANPYLGLDDFFPEYFRNYENFLQESRSRRFAFAPLPPLPPLWPPLRPLRPLRRNRLNTDRTFNPNIDNQRLASNAAWKAYDLTSNQADYFPNFPFRSPFGDFPGFPAFPPIPSPPAFPSLPGFDMPMPMPNFGDNSAFAAAALAPGFSHQIAAISPSNPNNPNVNKLNRFADSAKPGRNFYSVSSSSFATSNNVNGEQQTQRGAETVVNDNGNVMRYKVES